MVPIFEILFIYFRKIVVAIPNFLSIMYFDTNCWDLYSFVIFVFKIRSTAASFCFVKKFSLWRKSSSSAHIDSLSVRIITISYCFPKFINHHLLGIWCHDKWGFSTFKSTCLLCYLIYSDLTLRWDISRLGWHSRMNGIKGSYNVLLCMIIVVKVK